MYKMNTKKWHLTRIIFLISGIFITGSILLGFLIHPYFYYFTGLIGFMQGFFALTGYCPMAILLNKLGINEN